MSAWGSLASHANLKIQQEVGNAMYFGIRLWLKSYSCVVTVCIQNHAPVYERFKCRELRSFQKFWFFFLGGGNVKCDQRVLLINTRHDTRYVMGFAVRVRSAGQKYGPTCHQRDRADVTEFVTLVRLSSLGQHVGVLALAGYKRRKSALTAGPIIQVFQVLQQRLDIFKRTSSDSTV